MKIIKGSCHCGKVEFEIQLKNGFGDVRRCNCSICKRKGAIMGSVPMEYLTITKGKENLSLYQWNTQVAEHYFCKTCGIYTHHKRRSVPTEYGFNVGCIDGVDPSQFTNVREANGAAQ